MKLFKALVGAAMALSIGASAAAQSSETRYRATYYSNAQYNEVVGYVIVLCDNSSYGNGYPTQFYEEEWFDCP